MFCGSFSRCRGLVCSVNVVFPDHTHVRFKEVFPDHTHLRFKDFSFDETVEA